MKLFTLAALAAVAVLSSGCSGCSTVEKVISDGHAVLEGQRLDEQAMGAVDALGSAANISLEAAAKSGLASHDQLLAMQTLRTDMDAAHAAARAAYDAGDAKTFHDKLAALTALSNKAAALYREVTK